MGELRPGDPVVVSSRKEDFKTIEALVEEHSRRVAQPLDGQPVLDAFAGQDPALAGYFFSRLWEQQPQDPEQSTELFLKAIGSPSVPPEAWREVSEDIVLSFPLLQNGVRQLAITQFSEFAMGSNVQAAFAGFRGLGQVARFAPASLSDLNAIAGLADAYRCLVKEEGMPRELPLERSLEIVLELS
jgi:hypothetical protein